MMRTTRLVVSAAVAVCYLYSRPAVAQTDTSTSGIQFPENTGSLPRAKMPEGSAEQRPADPNAPHTHEHSHGGKVHSHTHSHAHGADHDHVHEAPSGTGSTPHTHEHTHDGGEPHSHEHDHAHGDGHEHGHEHVADHAHTDEQGEGHEHLHGTGPGQHTHEGDEHGHTEKEESKLRFTFDGYLKVIAEVVENDPLSSFIGRNDGFRVGNARVGINAVYGEDLSAYISLEASVPRTEDYNESNAELTVGPRDLYIAYQLSKHAQVSIGRFKAPYDIGELESEGHRIFIDVPVESRGVAPTQGFQLEGMRQGRQIGVMLHRGRIGLSKDGFDIGYALALTNGRTESFALNDNDRPAGFARFSLYYGDYVNLNLGGFTDTRTTGELPSLFDEETKGAEASLVVSVGDLRIEGQLLFQRTSFPTAGTPHVNGLGFHAQWSYRIWDLEAAYRFSYYDPNHRFEIDAVNEHTLGASYYARTLPLRFTLNATLVQEQRGRELENNRIALLAQYNF